MGNIKFNIKKVRLLIIAIVTVLHITVLLLVSFTMETREREPVTLAVTMRLFNAEEEAPPPPPPPPLPEPILPLRQDTVTEHIIESDEELPPPLVPLGPVPPETQIIPPPTQTEYLPMRMITVFPELPEDEITRNMVYPPIARGSNIEGQVFLELLIDPGGNIRDVIILRENPPNRGFGEAAVNAFRGIRAISPALADGLPVAVRLRYNLTFRLR